MSNLAWAAAKGRALRRGDAGLAAALARAAAAHRAASSSQALANVLWALATSRHAPRPHASALAAEVPGLV